MLANRNRHSDELPCTFRKILAAASSRTTISFQGHPDESPFSDLGLRNVPCRTYARLQTGHVGRAQGRTGFLFRHTRFFISQSKNLSLLAPWALGAAQVRADIPSAHVFTVPLVITVSGSPSASLALTPSSDQAVPTCGETNCGFVWSIVEVVLYRIFIKSEVNIEYISNLRVKKKNG